MKDSSKLRQGFKKHHIDNSFIITILLLVALVALAVAVMFLDGVASYLQELLGLNENGKYKVIQTIGFCIAGVLLVWQAWATNKRAKAMEKNAKSAVAGRQEERLKNAVEHLGHKKSASVRISGAYELFHLAKDTENLRQTVLKILCAHIRKTATDQIATGQMTGKNKEKHKTKPSEEIQSLLTLFFAQKDDLNVFENCPINLQGSYLNGADLPKAQLQGADLPKAQLQGADLPKAQLQGADLSKAQLQGANLSKAQLQGTNLSKAQLQGADLSKAQLQGANLSKAQLQGADLSKAQLQGANLMETQLQGVSSQEADHYSSVGFESRIRDRIGKDSDLDGIIFAGGLQQKDLDTLCEGLSDDQGQALQEKLKPHVGKPVSHKLPRGSGAKTGTYAKAEAEQWITEYNKAMEEAPRTDDTADAASAPDSDKGKGD